MMIEMVARPGMEEKLVRLFVGRLAVVAGDSHLNVGREDLPMYLVEPLDDVLGNDDGVGPPVPRTMPHASMPHAGD